MRARARVQIWAMKLLLRTLGNEILSHRCVRREEMERLMRASRPSLGVGCRTDGIAPRPVGSRERRGVYGPVRPGIRSGVTVASLPDTTGVDLFVDRAIDFIRVTPPPLSPALTPCV